MNAEQRQQLKFLRGSLMRCAERTFDNGLAKHVTERQFHLAAGPRDWELSIVKPEIALLCELGYLQREESKIDQQDRDPQVFYKITAAGLRLAKGETADGMIEFD